MCEVVPSCDTRGNFWVQTRRQIDANGIKSGRNIIACARHLARAVRELGELNREAANGMHYPDTDGVVVKLRVPNPDGRTEHWA